MDRQGAGDVFVGIASRRGGPRIATGRATGKFGNREFDESGFDGAAFCKFDGSGIGKFDDAGFDGFDIRKSSSPHSRMRLAQRRAMTVMLSYMWRKARLRACQAKELFASPIARERASFGSRPQRRKACRAMTQRSSASQPACQAVSQTMPSGLGGLWRGQKRRTARARMPMATCSLRQAATSQMSHKGVRCFPFMQRSIAPLREGGRNSEVIPHLFSSSALIGRQNFFRKVFLTRGSRAVFLHAAKP